MRWIGVLVDASLAQIPRNSIGIGVFYELIGGAAKRNRSKITIERILSGYLFVRCSPSMEDGLHSAK